MNSGLPSGSAAVRDPVPVGLPAAGALLSALFCLSLFTGSWVGTLVVAGALFVPALMADDSVPFPTSRKARFLLLGLMIGAVILGNVAMVRGYDRATGAAALGQLCGALAAFVRLKSRTSQRSSLVTLVAALFSLVLLEPAGGGLLLPVATPLTLGWGLVALGELRRRRSGRSETRRDTMALVTVLVLGAALVWGMQAKLEMPSGNRSGRGHARAEGGPPLIGHELLLPAGTLDGEDESPVLRATDDGSSPYWRCASFTRYEGGAWEPSLWDVAFDTETTAAAATASDSEVILLTRGRQLLPVPDDCLPLLTRRARVSRSHGGAVLIEGAVFIGGRYHIRKRSVAPRSTLSPGDRTNALQIPPALLPHLRRTLQQIEKDRDPLEYSKRVNRWVQSHGRYGSPGVPSLNDPVVDFLQGRRQGLCGHFATATVLLLRAAGIPSRYVSGYLARERSRSGQLVLRQRDAHAWVEAWVPDRGWVRLDPTPVAARPVRSERAFSEAIAHFFGGLSKGWLAAVGALLTLGVALVAWQRRRSRPTPASSPDVAAVTPSAARDSGPADLAHLRSRFDQVLAARQVPCPDDLTWAEHLSGARSVLDPVVSEKLHSFVEAYTCARFGPPDGWRGSYQAACRSLDWLEAERGAS